MVDKEESIERYSHEPVDYKNRRLVPLPKAGGAIVKRYNDIKDKYFE